MAAVLDRGTLVLNRSWLPIHVTPVRRAVCMLYQDIARVVATDTLATYGFQEWIRLPDAPATRFLRTPSLRIPVPEVVLLRDYDKVPRYEAPFTRKNLFSRDDYTCQYCGKRLGADRLTIDHVSPRSRGGSTSWENCVLACMACNARKGNRTLGESGQRLLRAPARPRWTPYLNLRSGQRLESWEKFAPSGRMRIANG